MARPPKDPLLCCDCQERPPASSAYSRWPSKRCEPCYDAFAAKREANRIAKARRFRAAMNAAGPKPAPVERTDAERFPGIHFVTSGEPTKMVPITGTFPCCGVTTLGAHQDNVISGTCTREALRAALAAIPRKATT